MDIFIQVSAFGHILLDVTLARILVTLSDVITVSHQIVFQYPNVITVPLIDLKTHERG